MTLQYSIPSYLYSTKSFTVPQGTLYYKHFQKDIYYDDIYLGFNFFSLNGYLSELEENNHNYLDDCKTQTKISIFFSHDEIT